MDPYSKTNRKLVLVTNDDGVQSPFLEPLLESIKYYGDIYLVAPASENSWISTQFSKQIKAQKICMSHCKKSWQIVNGSPNTCVDLAIHHLLPRTPDLAISGVNIGANTSWQYILSSGTFAAAQHAFTLGVPSMALSQSLSPDLVGIDRNGQTPLDDGQKNRLDSNFSRIPKWLDGILERDEPELWNVNLPYVVEDRTAEIITIPAKFDKTEFFLKKANSLYEFCPKSDESEGNVSDRSALKNGNISISKFQITL